MKKDLLVEPKEVKKNLKEMFREAGLPKKEAAACADKVGISVTPRTLALNFSKLMERGETLPSYAKKGSTAHLKIQIDTYIGLVKTLSEGDTFSASEALEVARGIKITINPQSAKISFAGVKKDSFAKLKAV